MIGVTSIFLLDVLLRPSCEAGQVNNLINELLIHIGLIKVNCPTKKFSWREFIMCLQSEDKKFKPVKDIEGPLLTLKYVVRQDYFPRSSADIFIAFLTK